MVNGGALDSGTLRAHAAEVSTLHSRLGRVAKVYRGLEWNDESFGTQPGWLADALDRRTVGQAELLEYVAKNFDQIAADLVTNLAAGTGPISWPEVRPDQRPAKTPNRPVADVRATIAEGAWIDDLLRDVPRGTPPADDPFAALPAVGLAWLLPRLAPLRAILEGLTGRPAQVTAQAAALHDMSAQLQAAYGDLQRMLRAVLRWPGLDVDAYLDLMANDVEALAGLVGTSAALATGAEAAEKLVTTVRNLVGELLAELAADVVRRAQVNPEAALLAPAIAAAIRSCHQQALRYLAALVSSLTELAELLEG